MNISPSQGLYCGNSTSGLQRRSPQVPLPSYLQLDSGHFCFNCLMLNASKCVSVDSVISRQAIFYNRKISENVFRRSNLTNKRKRPDALSLIKRIFGIKGCCTKFFQCDCHGLSATNSNCLCHRLVQLLKKLLRNAKRCQYKKLFLRHCSVKSKLLLINLWARATIKC